VQQLEAVEHVVGLERVHNVHDLRGRKAKGGAFAAGIRPVAAGLDGQLGAYADVWPHAESLAALKHNFQLAGHFENKEHVKAKAQSLKAKVDKFFVLVAVANNAGLAVAHERHGGNEFRLGADLQAVMVGGAELGYFFHNLLLLVDLDGKNATVRTGIIQTFDSLAE